MSRLLIAILLGVISVAFLREGTTPAGAGEFPSLIFPFPEGQTWQISKGYACELGGLSPCHPDSYDYSLDFVRVGGVTEGEAVRAVAAGTVVGYFYNDALGWQVEVRHSGGYRSFYGHLQAGPGFLPEDTPVAQGRTIGRAGCSGASCVSSHIHFSFNSGGGDINDTKPEPVCGYTGFQPGQSFINCFRCLRDNVRVAENAPKRVGLVLRATAALSRRGERTRASGLLRRDVWAT